MTEMMRCGRACGAARGGRAEARRCGGRQVVDHSLESFFQRGRTKINEQSHRLIQEPQICQELFAVNLSEFFHRLDLDDNTPFDEQVGTKALFEYHSVVFKADGQLPLDP